MRDLDYLRLLAKQFPTVKAASGEIINLKAICGLPKGTEYFFSDLHGEYEAFIHLLRSASGMIREKIADTFGHFRGKAVASLRASANFLLNMTLPTPFRKVSSAEAGTFEEWDNSTFP